MAEQAIRVLLPHLSGQVVKSRLVPVEQSVSTLPPTAYKWPKDRPSLMILHEECQKKQLTPKFVETETTDANVYKYSTYLLYVCSTKLRRKSLFRCVCSCIVADFTTSFESRNKKECKREARAGLWRAKHYPLGTDPQRHPGSLCGNGQITVDLTY